MKARFSLWLSALALPSLLVLGCGDEAGNDDLGVDMSVVLDLTPSVCKTIATWPSSDIKEVIGEAQLTDPFDFLTSGSAVMTTGTTLDLLTAQIWHSKTSMATTPRTVTISPSTTDFNCTTCLILDEGVDTNYKNPGTSYLARGGMVTIDKADTNPGSGMIDVSGSGIHFVEWDFKNDKPKTDGRCYDVGSFAIAGTYTNADGGADM